MSDVICKSCGRGDGFYREAEVQGTGWVDVQFEADDAGTITADEGQQVEEIQWDVTSPWLSNYGCSACGTEKARIEDLVVLGPEAIVDPIKRVQRFPIPGQMTFGPEPA